MTALDPDALRRYLAQSRGAIETVRAARRREEADASPLTPAPARVETTVEALRVAEEEMKVQNEELRVQNDELDRRAADLERVNRRYMDLFNLAPIGYVVTDDQGIITEVNLTAETLLSLTAGGLRSRPIVSHVPERDRKTLREQIAAAAAGKRPQWRGTIAPAQGSGPPVPVQFAVSLYGPPTPPPARPGEPRPADPPAARELLWSITNLARMASLESEVRRLDDGMWARVAERTTHLTIKLDALEAELRRLKEPPTGPENMRA